MHKLTLISTFTAVIAASFSVAQDKVPSTAGRAATTKALLEEYDENGNGKLDPEEIEAVARDRFRKWDTDGSGKVDQAELKAMRDQTTKAAPQSAAQRMAAVAAAREDARRQAERDREEKAKSEKPGAVKPILKDPAPGKSNPDPSGAESSRK